MTKIWTKAENDYNSQVNEYNSFLEKFGNAIVMKIGGFIDFE